MKHLILSICLASCTAAFSQSAAVNGLVTDSSGAIVPGAEVTITDVHTNVPHLGRANTEGWYAVPLLSPGHYKVEVHATSFKPEQRDDVELETGQDIRLNFVLSAGRSNDQIVVSADSSSADTSTAVGTVIDSQKVLGLPLNGRQFYSLALLVPGVAPPVPGSSLSFRGGFNVAGSNENLNAFTFDGFNNNDAAISGPSFRLSIDAIQEFKVYTGTYGAEFGRNAAGQIVVTSRSGGNNFHGNLFEFLRNDVADAKNFFAKNTVPPLKRNQFGGTLGGPLRRDRTFFFFSYEGLRLRQGISLTSTVPTLAMRNGVFPSAIHAPAGYSPDVVRLNPSDQTFSINPQALTPAQTQAFTIGKALLSYYPNPSNTNTASSQPSQNFLFNGLTSESTNQYSLRLDHRLGASDTVFATLNYLHDETLTPNNPICGNFTIPGFTCNAGLTTQLYGAGWTHSLTPNVLNELRVGFQRLRQPRFIVSNANFDQQFGIPAFTGTPPSNINGIPTTSLSGFASFGDANNLPQDRADNTFDYVDSLFWNIGKHSIKAGFEISPFQGNFTFFLFGSAGLTFTGGNTGNSVADALLGLPFISFRNIGPSRTNLRTTDYAAYIQDQYKVRRNLTIDYGLRWESFTPITSPSNQISSFDPILGQPFQAGVNGYGRAPYAVWNGGFAPRLGFSYQPTSKGSTVIRGGFGISYASPIVENGFAFFLFSPPLHDLQVFAGPSHMLPNPFVSTGPPSITPAGVARDFRPGQVRTWSVGVQQELSRNTTLDIGYIGASGVHLENQRNINQPAILSPGVVGPSPYPAFGGIVWAESEGNSNYHSLQVRLDRRYKNGLNLILAETYGKSLDNIGLFTTSTSNVVASLGMPQNSRNLSTEYGRSDFDIRNRLVISPIYELPFGRGKRYFTAGWTNTVFGGFRLAGILTLQTGSPSTPYLGTAFPGSKTGNSSLTGGDTDRPDLVPGQDPNRGPKNTTQWFNTSAFRLPQPGTFGNAGRNILKGPNFTNLDVALHRDFLLGGEQVLQFRGEIFNVANHPLLGLPNATLNSVSPTTGVANTSSSFGPISSTQSDSREIQLALKLLF